MLFGKHLIERAYAFGVLVFWIVLALIVVLVAGAAFNDWYWRRKGFRTEIRGSGRGKTKVRVRVDPGVPFPANPVLGEQDWVRQRDLDEPES